MNFHSVTFGVFLCVVFGLFWLTYRHRNLRSAIMLVASYVFYGAFNPLFLGLIGFSTLLDHKCGLLIHRSESERTRRFALLVSLVMNLGLLGFFKYYDFGVENLGRLFASVGLSFPLETLGIVVPVGISFYTFQTLSYTIDLYRRRMEPARNLLDFALFVAFFPQLVAGPIVRAADFLPQLERPPRFTRERLHDGLYRIAIGLGKKVLIADVVGKFLIDPVYTDPGSYSAVMHVIVLYGFLVQIYYDFSGYSDIAIGSARLFGFDLPENFKLPFRALSVREFWRRWHITLSSWLQDYVYFPLGGSRRAEPRVLFNLMVTMILIGLWHGASWPWALFGTIQGIAMCLERTVERAWGRPFATSPLRRFLLWVWMSQFIAITYICVRAEDMGELFGMLLQFGDAKGFGDISHYAWISLTAGLALHFMPEAFYPWARRVYLRMPTVLAGIIAGVIAGLAGYLLLGEQPFIYFQF